MLDPGLEVADTGFDDGARRQAVSGQPTKRILGEIINDRVAMLT